MVDRKVAQDGVRDMAQAMRWPNSIGEEDRAAARRAVGTELQRIAYNAAHCAQIVSAAIRACAIFPSVAEFIRIANSVECGEGPRPMGCPECRYTAFVDAGLRRGTGGFRDMTYKTVRRCSCAGNGGQS